MKKHLMLISLALAMCLTLSACGGTGTTDEKPKEPTTDAGEIIGTQKEDVGDNEGKYFYQELNVKDFDPSKFDGIIKFDCRYAWEGEILGLPAPLTFAQMQEAGLFFEEDALHVNYLQEVAEEGSSISPSLYAHNDKSEDGTVIVVDVVIPNINDDGLTYQQILENGSFKLYYEDCFLGDLIHTDSEKSNSTEFKDVVATLGAPTMIYGDAMSLDGDLSSGYFSYIYKYDNYALAFEGLEFTGDEDSGTFYDFYYLSNEKVLNNHIEFLKECGYTLLAE